MHIGPAGLLKTRIMEGELADVFISANSENVSALGSRVFQQQVLTYNQLMLTQKIAKISARYSRFTFGFEISLGNLNAYL